MSVGYVFFQFSDSSFCVPIAGKTATGKGFACIFCLKASHRHLKQDAGLDGSPFNWTQQDH